VGRRTDTFLSGAAADLAALGSVALIGNPHSAGRHTGSRRFPRKDTIMFYKIPYTLASELEELKSYIDRYQRGEIDAATLKVRRVPFGCYEQREDGTYMVRIRTTGGALTPSQLRRIAEISSRYGSDAIHITTRQEFQIHDLALENILFVMRELLEAGLASRGGGGNTVRNILVSPDAGVGIDEVFDPSPYAFALTSRLIAEPDSWLLPRKFKIAFSNSLADSAYAEFNDLGFVAQTRESEKGFRVFVAGGLGAKPEVGHLLHDFIPAGDVYVVTSAVKRLFDKHGNRKNRNAARLRFLWKSLGQERFLELYQEELQQIRTENPDALLVEDVPQSSDRPNFAPEQDDSPEFLQWRDRYVEKQRDSELVSIRIPFFLGNVSNASAIRLAEFLEHFGNHVLRATFGQNLRLRNIPRAYLANVFHVVREVVELSGGPRLVGDSISCTGADTCKLGICLSKGALSATAERLKASTLDLDRIEDFHLNLSGCPNTCGQHMLADLGFFGNVGRSGQDMFPAYAIVAGAEIGAGKARLARQIDRVSARDLPEFVHEVLKLWIVRKNHYPSFAAYIDGEGTQEIREIASRFREIPPSSEDKSYYQDWGADKPFSLVGRGVGECSAGLFDLIEVDLKGARQLLEELRAGDVESGEALYSITLRSARALLITRGIEAPTDVAVFQNFAKHFIQSGLIDRSFETVIARAQEKKTEALDQLQEEVIALLNAVEALYRSMDNSLRFPAEAKTPA
jgi:sulfite reductase (ferredoxin)